MRISNLAAFFIVAATGLSPWRYEEWVMLPQNNAGDRNT
jgi:hypothetical protein